VLKDRSIEWRQIGIALAGGAFAASAGSAVTLFLRTTVQVRSAPERILEWLLIYVPPDLFEANLLRFGVDAKRYALWVTSIALFVALIVVGTMALARRWPADVLLGLGVGLWLAVMLVVMPLSGAGIFASELVDGVWAAVLGNFAVCLAYASGLALVRLGLDFLAWRPTVRATVYDARRAAILGVGTTFVALVSAYLVPAISFRRPAPVPDPAQPGPAPGPDRPSSHPETTTTREVQPRVEATRTQSAGSQLALEFPEPRPARSMKRDVDGAVLPAGRRKGELTDLMTSNDDFYIVTKNAGGDPVLRAADWRLLVDGEVENRIEVGYAAMRAMPAVETTQTLECISNFVAHCELAPFGCDLISNARWRGVRLVDVLRLAGGVKPAAQHLLAISADEYTTVHPIEVALDPDTLLVFEMNGEVLPREHGYPVRMLVPGRFGMKNAKWLIGLRLVRREVVDWYGQRKWSEDAVVKSMTRIDIPLPGATIPAGEYNIAGIAYAGDRGVRKVEFSTDDGMTWQEAKLIEPPLGRDTWVRWIGRFAIEAGASISLLSRATDGADVMQVEEFGLPQPNGSSGWHRLDVKARGA